MHVRWAIIVALSRKALKYGERTKSQRKRRRIRAYRRTSHSYYHVLRWRWEFGPRGNPRSTSLPTIKRSEQPGTRFSLFLRYLRVIHVEDRTRAVTLLMPAPAFIFYAYILLALLERDVQRRLNRNATRALTFYSPETIDRYQYGKYITAPMPGSPGELLRLIHTGRRYYPAGFPRLIRKPLENRIALFHPARRPIAHPQPHYPATLRPVPARSRENSGGSAAGERNRGA